MAGTQRPQTRVSVPMLALLLAVGGVVFARAGREGPSGPCVLCDGADGPYSGIPGPLGCATNPGGIGTGEQRDLSRWYTKPASLACRPTSGFPADCSEFNLCCDQNSIGYFACAVAFSVDDCQVIHSCVKRCCFGGRSRLQADPVPSCGKGAVSHTLVCF